MGGGSFRIVLAGGGTGGHLFPALAVADELRGRHPGSEITFVGGRRGLETRLVPAAGYPLRTLGVSGLKGVSPWSRFAGAVRAGWAVLRSMAWMYRRRPDLVIGVGGYASGPAVLAARMLGVKTMVMEQNHFPGATNRFLAKHVDAVCLPSEAARQRLAGPGTLAARVTVTGNPVRREFADIGEPSARAELSVLVCGGSRGARSINDAVVDALPRIAKLERVPRVVHQTGRDDEQRITDAYRRQYPDGRWEVHAFIDDRPARFADADLVLSRAGATTVAELAASGRPAILVPYPFAADDHQRLNAEAVRDAGGALMVLDGELDGDTIAELVRELGANPARLRNMGRASRTLAHPDATARIADVADSLLMAVHGGGDVS
jgi:UDP-N-acetylglucosamine--N-acetylmuramyl-(pentapeptide) pyrophosphoryl-undecaprenol N-acetylglucosamine transferase